MTTETQKLAAPKDDLLGICNALGEDFGFNPLWIRLALGAAFILQPVGVIVGYLALGLVVLVSRLAFPNAKRAQADAVVTPLPAGAPVREEQVFAKAA